MSPPNSCRRLTAHGLMIVAQVAPGNAVVAFQDVAILFDVEQTERRFVLSASP